MGALKIWIEGHENRAKLKPLQMNIYVRFNMLENNIRNLSYSNPPVTEVYCSIAFDPPADFKSIYVKDVWELFKDDFPENVEMPWVDPQFEIFGGIGQNFQLNLPFRPFNKTGTRQWFLSGNRNYLIQFQRNVLTFNWRKRGSSTGLYPSFEFLLDKFKYYIEKLNKYFAESLNHQIVPKQCEVFYSNSLHEERGKRCADFLKCLTIECGSLEDMTFSCRQPIYGEDTNPIGRFMCNINLQTDNDKKKKYILNFLIRGRPAEGSLESAFDFLSEGHKKILEAFDGMTTEAAHELWGRDEK